MARDRRLPNGDTVVTALVRLVLGGLVLGLGPLARVRAYTWDAVDDTTWELSVALVVAVAIAVWLVSFVQHRVTQPLLALAVAGAAAGAMYPLQGKMLAAWLAVTTLAAAWGVHRVRPAWFVGRPDGSATPGLLLLAVLSALVAGDRLLPPRVSLTFTAMMAAPLLLSLPLRPARFVRRVVERFAVLVGGAVSVVLLAVLSIVAVVVPWAAQRLIRWNPIEVTSPGGWISLEPAGLQGRRMWMDRSERVERPAWHRLHGLAATALTLALLVPLGLVAQQTQQNIDLLPDVDLDLARFYTSKPETDEEAAPPPNVIKDRIQAEPWFNQLSAENQLAFERGHLSQWVGSELGDVDGKYVAVKDGRRESWVPPAPTCGTPVDVWVFGGSTTFSVAARNEHTVPSALAKAAAADGLAVRVLNWGVPGDVAWQEGRRLERGLAGDLARPDLVVFYDGFNDMSTVSGVGRDRGAVGDFVGPLDRVQMAALTKLGSIDDGRRLVLDFQPPVPDRTPEEISASALDQYLAAADSSRRLLESYGIPEVRFAQPTLWSREVPIKGEPLATGDSIEVDRLFRAGLTDDIIDLAHMFEVSDGAIYNDDVHTDERGNRLVAAELYRHLEPQLRELATKGGSPCS